MLYVVSMAWTYTHLALCTLSTCEFWRNCFSIIMRIFLQAECTRCCWENSGVWNHERDTQYAKTYNDRQGLFMLSFSKQIH